MTMSKHLENKIQILELQLEEAVQMLRLVAANKRTCLEIEEWLEQNFPENQNDISSVMALLSKYPPKKV